MHHHATLHYSDAIGLLELLLDRPSLSLKLDEGLRLLATQTAPQAQLEFHLPLAFPPLQWHPPGVDEQGRYSPLPRLESVDQYRQRIPLIPDDYAILLIQAGQCSLGYFEAGAVVDHKVIRKYMVRKSQGKAQITHLHTKGKSRAGSRIRLQQTAEFCREINERVGQWQPPRVFYSCSERLWGLLFQSQPPPPFDKSDDAVQKLPYDVQRPTHKQLLHTNHKLLQGRLRWQPGFCAVPLPEPQPPTPG